MAGAGKSLTKGTVDIQKIRIKFDALLAQTNKEHPAPSDVKALSDLLNGNRSLELWRNVASAGHMAELTIVDNASAVVGLKECWKYRLQALKKELGSEGAPILEQLLSNRPRFVD